MKVSRTVWWYTQGISLWFGNMTYTVLSLAMANSLYALVHIVAKKGGVPPFISISLWLLVAIPVMIRVSSGIIPDYLKRVNMMVNSGLLDKKLDAYGWIHQIPRTRRDIIIAYVVLVFGFAAWLASFYVLSLAA